MKIAPSMSTFQNLKLREACLLQEPLAVRIFVLRAMVSLSIIRIFILVVKLLAPSFVKARTSKVEEFNYTLF